MCKAIPEFKTQKIQDMMGRAKLKVFYRFQTAVSLIYSNQKETQLVPGYLYCLVQLVLLKILILFKKSKISDFFDKNRIIIKKKSN